MYPDHNPYYDFDYDVVDPYMFDDEPVMTVGDWRRMALSALRQGDHELYVTFRNEARDLLRFNQAVEVSPVDTSPLLDDDDLDFPF